MAPGRPAPEFDDEDRAGARAWREAVRAPVVRDLLESVFADVDALARDVAGVGADAADRATTYTENAR